jgi:uncharacterized membrane protein YoaK (UPF0700 family)
MVRERTGDRMRRESVKKETQRVFPKGRYSRSELLNGILMVFIAGSINAGGFLVCKMFVSHVTGFATLFGVSMARMSIIEGLSMLSVPLFFLVGSMLAGYLTEVQLKKGKKPRFDMVMGTIAALLTLVALLGSFDFFGVFGADYQGTDYGLLAMLCGSCGLQNAAVTIGSKNGMRATHLTGLTTDLGIDLIKSLTSGQDWRRVVGEFYLPFERASMVLSFCIGGLVGAVFYNEFKYLGFLLPAGLALISGIFSEAFFPSNEGGASKKIGPL